MPITGEQIEEGCGCITHQEWDMDGHSGCLIRQHKIKCTYHGGKRPTTVTAEMVKADIITIAQQLGTLRSEMDEKIGLLKHLETK